MNEQLTKNVVNASEDLAQTTDAAVKKPKHLKLIIICSVIVVVIAVAFIFLFKSEFDRVKEECLDIAGMISGSGDYFTIDTYPDHYKNMDATLVALLSSDTQEKALKAIRHANEELGFNGSLYSEMLETNALMGRQSEENDKYKVSWKYHPDEGLEVTYEKK